MTILQKLSTKTARNAIVALGLSVALFLLSGSAVLADPYQPPAPSKDILIDKMVAYPVKSGDTWQSEYVDNLNGDVYSFAPGDLVYFRLRVKNTSAATLTDVVVTDYAPGYVTLLPVPGTVSNNVHTINAGNFAAYEEKVFIIKGRINTWDNVPAGTTCVVNKARAEDDGIADEDTAQFCIKKVEKVPTTKGGVTPAPATIPETGTPHALAILLSSGALGYVGMKLRRA